MNTQFEKDKSKICKALDLRLSKNLFFPLQPHCYCHLSSRGFQSHHWLLLAWIPPYHKQRDHGLRITEGSAYCKVSLIFFSHHDNRFFSRWNAFREPKNCLAKIMFIAWVSMRRNWKLIEFSPNRIFISLSNTQVFSSDVGIYLQGLQEEGFMASTFQDITTNLCCGKVFGASIDVLVRVNAWNMTETILGWYLLQFELCEAKKEWTLWEENIWYYFILTRYEEKKTAK